jgi:uncharacterized OB-fold protein
VSDQAYSKFLPEAIPPWQMPFWESLRRREAAVQKCSSCGAWRYIPKERCPKCYSADWQWTAISGRGEIYTYTVVRRAPTPAYQAEAPYVIAHVTMDEGFRMAAILSGVDPDDVRIGSRVKLVYEEATPQWTLFGFEPDAGEP